MKVTTTVIAAALFSLAGCRSHKAVERTVAEEKTVVATDTSTFSRRAIAESVSDGSMVTIEYFPPDTAGRQAVKRIALARRTSAASAEVTDNATRTAGQQERQLAASTEASTPIRPCRWALIATLGTALTLILLTLHKIKQQ